MLIFKLEMKLHKNETDKRFQFQFHCVAFGLIALFVKKTDTLWLQSNQSDYFI